MADKNIGASVRAKLKNKALMISQSQAWLKLLRLTTILHVLWH